MVERERNVKDRNVHRVLLRIIIVSGQNHGVTCSSKQRAAWSILSPVSIVTNPAIPMTRKHRVSECDRQEQQSDAAVTAVS